MCTVTYIPLDGSFLLASNRDENRGRPPSLPPAMHLVHGQRLLFPRDGLAGGTWIGVNTAGWSMVLLNGAYEKHQPKPPYRLSRGLVMLDLLTATQPETIFTASLLLNIEPFTVVMAGHGKLRVGRWDGARVELETLNPGEAHIWSSVTLYPANVRARRESWFSQWLKKNPFPAVDELIGFHQFTGDGDPENDLRMERSNGIFTNSITVLDCTAAAVDVHQLDLRNDTRHLESLSFITSPSSRR